MPFLQAGFNARNFDTGIRGWTRHVRGGKFAPAELRIFTPSNDYFWYGARFLSWGECVVLGTHHGFELAWEYQNGLAHCVLETREEVPAWQWVELRRARLARGEVLDE
jgi:hypothetical protein